MPTIDPRDATSLARFLATSRSYFSLPERRLVTRSAFHNLRWAILRLALVAGGTGALFGSTAMADENETRTIRNPGGTTQLSALATPSRRSVEKMP